jgi:fructosamine-3-kinase
VTLPQGAREARRVGGGDINEAFHLRLADGREAFVKTRADAAPGEYTAEAAGLAWLAEPQALRTPQVLEVGEDYLALEWVERGRLDARGEQELGRGLALTHEAGAPRFGDFGEGSVEQGVAAASAGGRRSGDIERQGDIGRQGGAERRSAATFGSLRLSNEPTSDWPSFYAERRLRPLARMASERGVLGARALSALERICEQIEQLAGPAEPPARLHGDLWSGNVLADGEGRPWLIDPSAYGGHREVDLAMLALFGAPSQALFASYEEVAPLADGWRERVGLYQLLPLLVHALLFGGSYCAAAEQMALRYG